MEVAVISAARWVVGKALGPVSDGLLEAWAASKELGPNVDALKMELLYAQGMLNNTRGREIDNQALNELLQKLRDLAYNAEDVLDELDYFRIQDELEGTYEAADEHAKGCVCNLFLNAHHTAKAVGKLLWFPACSCATSPGDPREPREEDAIQQVPGCAWPCARPRSALDNTSSLPHNNQANEKVSGCMRKLASGARNTIRDVGKRLHCSSLPFVRDDDDDSSTSALCGACMRKAPQGKHAKETPKLEFDRVDLSRRMKRIVEQLQPVCAKVTSILNLELLGSTRSTAPGIAKSRPSTTSEIVEPNWHGREPTKKSIIDSITDKYCGKDLTILPIVGPGGIGKTTLVQHIYHSQEVQNHFQVRVWNCVSQNFNVNKLIEEIKTYIPRVEGEKEHATVGELIEQRLKSKRFLLILDDIWRCEYEDWKRLLVPLTKGQAKGNIILVTTRFPVVAEMVKSKTTQSSIDLEGLDREAFRKLFLACVFDDQESRNAHSELLETGGKIAEKLKGNPLAAKTVGRLLRNHLDPNHWTRVLESREWEMQTGDHDIMPALKLSYDYLPFHLQQCFSYCALFPEDYKFNSEELIHLWIGLGLVDTTGQNKRIEDVGLSYLNDLGNHGFFRKDKANGSHYYVIHDLLHELATKVSSYECLSIYSSNVRSIQIPPSILHLSIIIDERDVNDKMTFEDYKRDLSALDKRMKAENLRTLMLFGEYHGSFANTFGDLFREAKALRVILLSKAYYTVEDVLHNLWKSVHLRYLRITSRYPAEVSLQSTLSRFYHLRVLDVQQCDGDFGFPIDMSNLVKLRHFLVRDSKVHSSIFEVGKIKFLQELTRFVVRKESKGFELKQIGQLVELGGSLGIYNLENVEGKEEADEAKLIHKKHLHELILEWDIYRSIKDPAREEHVLESLVPHSNLQGLHIRGHRCTSCPTWLGANLSVKSLESLYLDDVSWKNLPPLGELWVVNEHGEECQGCISGQSFQNLKRLELVKIPRLKKWVGNGTSHLFSHLEALIIKDCSELLELPFSHSTCCQSEQEANMSWFSRLRELEVVDCPKLLSLPPIPWTHAPCSAQIARAGSGFEELDYRSELSLEIKGKDGHDSMFWKVLAFYNLAELKELKIEKCPPIPRDHLQMLSSLKTLKICDSSIVLSPVEGEMGHVGCTLPVDRIEIERWGAGGKELTQLLSHFPKLTELRMENCQKITGLGVVEQQQMTATPASSPPSSANKIGEQQQQTRGKEEIAAAGVGGLLLLPPQLQELDIFGSPELSLRTNSLDDDTAGGTGGGGGLQGLHSLRSLSITVCPKLLSSYSSSSSGFPFLTSLEVLSLYKVEGMETLAPLSNLTSLATLLLNNCGDLRGEGLWPLLAQGHLTYLTVSRTPKFFVGSEATRSHDQEILRLSSKLQDLRTDDVAGVLAAPICSLLSSSLTNLAFAWNKEVERFTKEQEEALHLLTSLQELRFWSCDKLQCLPAGLHRLTSLKRLEIIRCPAIRSLPKDGLPSSLQELKIIRCPAIRSLPKDGSLRSLRVLDVHDSRNSEELRRQCRKLTGTIPIIRA